MSENDQDMLDEDKEAELLQALAAQAPAEEYVATSGEALPAMILSTRSKPSAIRKFPSTSTIWALSMTSDS